MTPLHWDGLVMEVVLVADDDLVSNWDYTLGFMYLEMQTDVTANKETIGCENNRGGISVNSHRVCLQ